MKKIISLSLIIVFILSCKDEKALSQNLNKTKLNLKNEVEIPMWKKDLDTLLEKNNPKNLDLTKHQLFIDTTRNSKFYKEIIEWKPSKIDIEAVNYYIKTISEKYKPKKISIENFPKKWIILRKYKGKYIIYNPCDGKTTSFEISERAVIFYYQLEPDADIISKLIKKTNDKIEIELKTISQKSKSETAKFTIKKTEIDDVYELNYTSEEKNAKYYVTPIEHIDKFDMIVNNCVKMKRREFIGFDDYKELKIEIDN